MPTGVHLVGSMPASTFSNPTSVWHSLFTHLPNRLARIPDGELHHRQTFTGWQRSVFPAHILRSWPPQPPSSAITTAPLPDPVPDPEPNLAPNQYLPPPPLQPSDLNPTAYDTTALASYTLFTQQRALGLIPAGVRFQVCLPLPPEVVISHVSAPHQASAYPLYEARMLEALASIQATIPPGDLAIQWDFATTIALLEIERGTFSHPAFNDAWLLKRGDVLWECMQVLGRMMRATNPCVEVGFHLCYGDSEHKHFVEPRDMGLLVEVANRIVQVVGGKHRVDWFHLPVPKDRMDAAYYAPLKGLELPQETELSLGLVHYGDLEGTRRRIAAAGDAAPRLKERKRGFGVATECGMGRTPKEHFEGIMSIAEQVAEPY